MSKITLQKTNNGSNGHKNNYDKHIFPDLEKRGVYRAIYERRDIRREFLPKTVPRRILMKLLNAAHHAGSVGFMQPWSFVVINDVKIKREIKNIFIVENEKAKKNYTAAKLTKYLSLKLWTQRKTTLLYRQILPSIIVEKSRQTPRKLLMIKKFQISFLWALITKGIS